MSIYVGLGRDYQVLGQSTKKSVIPKDYIAIVGDSHALGTGDWFKQAVRKHKFTQGDYHSAHVLYNHTGRDIISYGALGSGSLRGLVSQPITHFMHINSLRAFDLKDPEMILVYFFEGNDLNDNVIDLQGKYKNAIDPDLLYDREYFKNFIQKSVLEADPLYKTEGPLKNFLFTRFLLESVGDNVVNEIKRGYKKLKKAVSKKTVELSGGAAPDSEPLHHDTALIAGQEFPIPLNSQHPAMTLTAEQTKQAIYVFEQSLLFLADFFKESTIAVVYIPSPLSSYQWVSPTVTTVTSKGTVAFKSSLIHERSQELCLKIERIARKYDYKFADTRKFFRKAAAKEPIHGPKDWLHPNEAGYRALAQGILTAFFDEDKASGFLRCES
ncbi:MAG: hypothetical protein NPINA01_31670 [Nitrospinaceae bacterium]|nr:MAG: hypothetical protein NPINA01_31670 [Nitrospinaceae bacterium]